MQIVCSQEDDEDGIQQAFFSVINIIDKIKGAECPETKSLVVIITERKAIEILITSHSCRLLPWNEDFNRIHLLTDTFKQNICIHFDYKDEWEIWKREKW